ncbi:Alpha/Beta hydrolase protein [Mycena rosella]|uniref:Alpha/Beta hydrolase protein n=1 Tax=Mycena rosella TaxID=1033263 RepID=A0AAD7FZ84_MYCRO|nr:Alpha/Beta hydrolase protein [Mycena rosella]
MLPVLLPFLLACVTSVEAAALSTVTLDYGTFTGLTNTTNGIIYFQGIRYADPPVGELRWRAPVSPPSTHLGNVNATALGFACIVTTQKGSGATTDEDCLFGNVYIPIATTARSQLPVMVYFHGGGFETGRTRDAPPENILLGSAKPLIFITFEYRLGQFGFLAGTPVHQSGQLNAGLLDQRAELEWVQKYISKFGGNPSGCGHIDNGSATMACLRAAPTNTIATAGRNTLANLTSSLYPFGPITDGSFIRQRPIEAFRDGNFIRVPVMFGSNTDEGANWSATLDNPLANTSFPNAIEATVYNFLAGQNNTLTQASFQTAITRFYPLSDYNGSFSLQGQQMYGEMRYICTAIMITGAAQDAGLKAYQYHWDNPTLGSTYADELAVFFNGDEVFDRDDEALAIAMRQFWTSFVISGVPTANSSISWKASSNSAGGPRILLHPGSMAMEEVPQALRARCAFWNGLASEIGT